MSFSRSIVLILALMLPAAVHGEGGGVALGEDSVAPSVPELMADQRRNTAGYRFAAQAGTVAAMQNLAYALQLRELCANPRVSDEFVIQQLDRFSMVSGRQEDCQTLLEY